MKSDLLVTQTIKIGMYILSLWLLFLLIIVNKIDIPLCWGCDLLSYEKFKAIVRNNCLPFICVFLLLISLIPYILFNYIIDGVKEGPYVIKEVEDKNSEHLVFLATYVIPLVGFGLNSFREIINLCITLVLLGAIYIKTNLFYANPTLSLLGFKIFSAEFGNFKAILIAKEELLKGESINVRKLDRNIYFARKSIRVN